MAPPGAIAHSRALLCPRASSLSLSSSVAPLSPLGLGVLGRGSVRSEFYVFLRRYGRRSGQPSSSSLARRACVHYSGCSALRIAVFDSWYCSLRVQVFIEFVYWLSLKFARAPGLSRGRGRWQWRSLRPLAMPSFVARFAPLRRTTDTFPFRSLYSGGPLSSRPQPLGRGGDVAPCEDTREDLGLSL